MTEGVRSDVSLTDVNLQRFATFFFLAFLDERLATEVSDRAAATYKVRNPKKLDANSPEIRLLTIEICRSLWDANKRRMSNTKDVEPGIGSIGSLPAGVSLQPWVKFHKQTPDDEILTFLLFQVLSFSEQEVSESLKISIGTLRHRISRAVRALGKEVERD